VTDPAHLRLEGLSVRLGERRVVVDISVALRGAQLVALVGPNGAGKTTLLRALAGLLPITGTVTMDGSPITALDLRERARRFAYLPQGQTVHWPLPVRDVVALGRYPHGATDPSRLGAADLAAVEQAMRSTDVMELADRPVTQLSGGERSRVLLARVLAVAAPVILADEPTSSLDPRHQIEVMDLLHKAAQAGALVIVVTHDLGLAARFADTVIALQNGRLVSSGPPDATLSDALLAEVFQISAIRHQHAGGPIIVPWRPA
jgi:iron complex transport system ATP-binding protein